VILLFLVYSFSLPFYIIIPIYIVSGVFPQAILYLRVLRLKRIFNRRSTYSKVRELLHLGAKTSFAGAISTIAYSVDKLIIFNFNGSSSLALYSILIMIPQELARVFDSFFPYLYKKKIKIHILGVILISIFLVCIYALLFKNYSSAIFGSDYEFEYLSVLLSCLLFFSQTIEFLTTQKLYFALSKGEDKLVYISILNISLSFIIISLSSYFFGLNGALLGVIMKNVLLSTFGQYFILRFK